MSAKPQRRLWWTVRVLVLLGVAIATLLSTRTTPASAAPYRYDDLALARAETNQIETAAASKTRHVESRQWSAFGPTGRRGTSTTPSARTVATNTVPDPLPQYKPSGLPDRSSAVYINGVDAEGNVVTYGSRPGGIHAEDVAQTANPGGQMSRPFGWRTNPGDEVPTWQPINVCTQCQPKYPPTLFPPGTGFDAGGAWSSH